MIVAKCPLRISLIGGSTDLEGFLEKHGEGSVISFPCNLYTYISLFCDRNGFNNQDNQYIINYTTRESVNNLDDLKNDVARETLKHFKTPPISVSFHTDVFSSGSGLASSSSYMVALTKALYRSAGIHTINNIEICSKALEIERKFNPLTGYQDTYGCGVGGLKRMNFTKTHGETARVTITQLNQDNIFSNYDCHLIYTSTTRSSTGVLSSVDFKKSKDLLPLVDEAQNAIQKEKETELFKIINEGWRLKKLTSKKIISSPELLELDETLSSSKSVLCHRLCGAGGGGYFLVFAEKGADLSKDIKGFENISFKIKSDKSGAQVCNIAGTTVIM